MNRPIINFGEILWDQFPDYKRAGGSPFNVSVHLQYLGRKSRLISAIGDDQDGRELLSLMEEKEVKDDFILKNEYPTGTVSVLIGEESEPSYTINEDVAWDHITLTENAEKSASKARAFSFATLSQRSPTNRKTLSQIFDLLPPDSPRFLDLNLRPPFVSKEIIKNSLHQTNYAKFNQDEWSQVSDMFSLKDSNQLISLFDLRGIIITRGGDGCSFFNNEGQKFDEPAASLNSHEGDFVGVGDAFWACFIHHTLQQTPAQRRLEKANRYAGWVAEQKGGIPDPDAAVLKLVK